MSMQSSDSEGSPVRNLRGRRNMMMVGSDDVSVDSNSSNDASADSPANEYADRSSADGHVANSIRKNQGQRDGSPESEDIDQFDAL